jgi:hypothetical protein
LFDRFCATAAERGGQHLPIAIDQTVVSAAHAIQDIAAAPIGGRFSASRPV